MACKARAFFEGQLWCASGDTSNLDRSTAVWMENIVEALEAAGSPLKHVYFTQGCAHPTVQSVLTTNAPAQTVSAQLPCSVTHRSKGGLALGQGRVCCMQDKVLWRAPGEA